MIIIINKQLSYTFKFQQQKMQCQNPRQQQNMLLNLRRKKKQTIAGQHQIQKQIKQYFSDLTIQLHEKQQQILKNLQNRIYEIYQNIDRYCGMGEFERNQVGNRQAIERILAGQVGLVVNGKLRELVANAVLVEVVFGNTGSNNFDMSIEDSQISISHQKTSKKGPDHNFTILKSSYLDQINDLQEKIQKLMVKQDKLKTKLSEMQSKIKMKKLGNSYLPYEQKQVSNLLLQRLESQNKILIEQIADCSEKILGLRSQNSLLMKQKQNSQFLATEKKKNNESIHVIEQSVQYSQYQEKITLLEFEVKQLREQLRNQKQLIMDRQEQFLRQKSQLIVDYENKIQTLNEYKNRLQTECQMNISKKIQIQQKLQSLQTKHEQMENKHKQTNKQLQTTRQMNNNYGKLLKLKDDKIMQQQQYIKQISTKLTQSQQQYKVLYLQSAQKQQQTQSTLKSKQLQIDSLKSVLKKQQNEKNQIKDRLANNEEELYKQYEKIKILESEIVKFTKQKENYCKKQTGKVKKQLKKSHQDEKNGLVEDFKFKYGEFLDKLETLKREINDNKQRYDKKFKLYQNRAQLFKQKTAFEMKQMLQKLAKPGQKQKLLAVIQSYIQNQSSISLKNSQIKMLKQQIVSLKKNTIKKQNIRPSTENQVCLQFQQFEKKLFNEKLLLQQSIFQGRLKQQQEEQEIKIKEKQSIIEGLIQKCQNLQKNLRQLRCQLNTATASINPELAELKKTKDSMAQKQQKMQSQINSLKNNLNKTQAECQQVKQQLKLKKDLIASLKKQLKQKDLQKTKLNETITGLIQQSDKIRRTKVQADKKQAIFTQFKDKLINQSQLSEQICQLRTTLDEKQKQYKLELNKKQAIIKQMKVNQEMMGKKLKAMGNLEEELTELKQKLKKNKLEIERKDTLIEHLKDKQEKTFNQLQITIENSENQQKKIKKQLQGQKSKWEGLKLKLGKQQTNNQLLKLSLIRVYEQLSNKLSVCRTATNNDYTNYKSQLKTRYDFTVQKTPQPYASSSSNPLNMNKYKQALSILQLSSEDLDLFMGNPTTAMSMGKSIQPYSPIPNKMMQSEYTSANGNANGNGNSVKLAKILENQEIQVKAVLQVFFQFLIAAG